MTTELLSFKVFGASEKERAAFLKGLEFTDEFTQWYVDRIGKFRYTPKEAFEIFLAEKYGNEQQ
jgi:hypothetical protein